MSTLPPPLPFPQPAPKKGLGGCAIAAIVVGVLVGLVIIGISVGGYMFLQKAGGRSGVAKTAIGMANPDYDIIDFDDKKNTITVRHKKTGKTATFPISHMKDGRVDPSELGMTPDQAEGTGAAPEWVKYPHGKQKTAAQLMGMTTLIYQTDDPVDKVMDYYKSVIGEKGIQATTSINGAIVVTDSKGSLQLAVGPERGTGTGTIITVVYRAAK